MKINILLNRLTQTAFVLIALLCGSQGVAQTLTLEVPYRNNPVSPIAGVMETWATTIEFDVSSTT